MNRTLLSAAALLSATAIASPASAGIDLWGASSWGNILGKSSLLVGRDLNGVSLNGEVLDGHAVVGVFLEGATRDGEPLLDIELEATEFYGYDSRGHRVKTKRFVDVTFEAELDDGTALTLYVADRRRHPDHVNHDVFGYEVWYGTEDDYQPLCGLDEDHAPVLAIPLRGRWNFESGVPWGGSHIDDPTSFTFACEGYAVAKCVTGGYKPWTRTLTFGDAGRERGTLAAHHQACTRALRADYFGDGTSHTVDDAPINLYDGFGVRIDEDDWVIEAEWNADGAVCVNRTRLPDLDDLVSSLFASDCGNVSFFEDDTLLMTEAP